jgi:hypothetical protein
MCTVLKGGDIFETWAWGECVEMYFKEAEFILYGFEFIWLKIGSCDVIF